MSKPCPACADAENNPLTGFYNMACDACNARHLAQSPEFCGARAAGVITKDYEKRLFGQYGIASGATNAHEAAKKWADRIDAARARKAANGYA